MKHFKGVFILFERDFNKIEKLHFQTKLSYYSLNKCKMKVWTKRVLVKLFDKFSEKMI